MAGFFLENSSKAASPEEAVMICVNPARSKIDRTIASRSGSSSTIRIGLSFTQRTSNCFGWEYYTSFSITCIG